MDLRRDLNPSRVRLVREAPDILALLRTSAAVLFPVEDLYGKVDIPIVLLSALENGSPLGVVSWPVCRTFWASFWGWAGFYLTTAVLVAASAAVMAAALTAGMVVGTIVTGAVESVAWLIYFRMLGRLAWYCAEHSVHDDVDADEDQDQPGPISSSL